MADSKRDSWASLASLPAGSKPEGTISHYPDGSPIVDKAIKLAQSTGCTMVVALSRCYATANDGVPLHRIHYAATTNVLKSVLNGGQALDEVLGLLSDLAPDDLARQLCSFNGYLFWPHAPVQRPADSFKQRWSTLKADIEGMDEGWKGFVAANFHGSVYVAADPETLIRISPDGAGHKQDGVWQRLVAALGEVEVALPAHSLAGGESTRHACRSMQQLMRSHPC
jgi:hypothetical protein